MSSLDDGRKLFKLLIQPLNIKLVWPLLFVVGMAMSHLAWGQHPLKSGLRFSSHEVIKDQRTSLNLSPDQAFTFPNGFSLEFDVKFRPGDGHYGNIFRIIGNDQVNIDLVSNLASPSANFWLVLKDQVLFAYTWDDIPQATFGQWMRVRIDIDLKQYLISASLNGNYQEKKVDVEALDEFRIQFGACKYRSFLNTDVSPMTLKDVVLYDGPQEYRHWKLAKHAHHRVYDEIAYAKADVDNPLWEMDHHIRWRKKDSLRMPGLLAVVKDEAQGLAYFVTSTSICRYDTDSAEVDTLRVRGGLPFRCLGNQMIYNKYTDEIWSYSFDGSRVSKFDLSTQTWSLSDPDCPEPDFWHHNKWISSLDSSLYTYGGYGHYLYKSTIHRFGAEGREADSIDLSSQIPPRYLSATGLIDNQLFIFGGYGSKSGRQELSPEFYYDLYTLDTRDFSVKKQWTLGTPETPYVPSQYLLADTESPGFYTLLFNSGTFKTSLHLARFGIDAPEVSTYPDSIPYDFLDTDSWATFFLNTQTSELITLSVHDTEVEVYSLAYPPLFPEDVYQPEEVQSAETRPWIIPVMLSAVVVGLIFLFIRIARKAAQPSSAKATEDESKLLEDETHEVVQPYLPRRAAIYLLGAFQVFDRQGNDISADFTPTIKQLFLLILLTTLKNNKGVSSTTLKDILWFDKSATSARNNRNVTMSKLRGIFEKIGDVKLLHDQEYWHIHLSTDVYCDYVRAGRLIYAAKSQSGLKKSEITQLTDILSRGEVCPSLQTEWTDSFKADFANEVIDTLASLPYQTPEIREDHSQLLIIADCMLQVDSLNEDAIALKCAALYHTGKKSLAMRSYDLFCQEYQRMLGEEYLLSFNELLNHEYHQP